MHKVINLTIHSIMVICMIICVTLISNLGKEIQSLEAQMKSATETLGVLAEVASTNTANTVHIVDTIKKLPENSEFIQAVAELVVAKMPILIIEKEGDLESAVELALDAIEEISAEISKLETFEQIEALIEASLQADNVEEDESNSTVAETSQGANHVHATKPVAPAFTEEDVKQLREEIKTEVYESFERAGYGKMVDGKFVPRKPFLGAEIIEGEEHKYEPTAPFK